MADDLETAGLAFGKLSAEFIRTMVVPEVDAFRFAAYCGANGATKKEETLADGPAVIKAISAACSAMDDAEVPNTDRYLFITPALLQAVKDMDTTKSREVLSDFAGIVKVPQGRFYTAIKQLSGKDSESKGGYTKATGAADLNFMVIHKGALIQYTKHAAPKIITPEYNNDSDGYIFGYGQGSANQRFLPQPAANGAGLDDPTSDLDSPVTAGADSGGPAGERGGYVDRR